MPLVNGELRFVLANMAEARKYKQYNKLRDIISGMIEDEVHKSPKRKSSHAASQTPVKKSKYSHSRTETQSSIPFGIEHTPIQDRTAPSPVVPTSIGPTPHRDGKILGLFAFLDTKVELTPSKATGGRLPETEKLLATPSKTSDMKDLLGKTPLSTTKSRLLDSMVTPLKERDGNAVALWANKSTPKSVRKLQFGTPAFLRRRPLAAVDESGEYTSPQKMKPKRRPFARGLSDLVANLRNVEEHAFDDEEEAMLEMEAEAMGLTVNPMPSVSLSTPAVTETESQSQAVLVPDSQAEKPALLGGFDDEAAWDILPEEQLDRGRPMKEWKKKAPKRTTRKVNMRPTIVKRPVEGQDGVGLRMLSDDEDETVPETQFDATQQPTTGDEEEDLNLEHPENEDDEYDHKAETGKKRKRSEAKMDGSAKGEKKKKRRAGKANEQREEEGKVKKAVRKVNELAHANFKRLKLRNRGAKGGPGFNSRFRRRR